MKLQVTTYKSRGYQSFKRPGWTPLQYILSTETPTVSTPLGEVQFGSFLSYQVKIYEYDLYTYVLVVLSITKVSW